MKRINIHFLIVLFTVSLFSCTSSKNPVVGVWECVNIQPLEEQLQTTTAAPEVGDDGSRNVDDKREIPPTDPQLQEHLEAYPDISETIMIKRNMRIIFTTGNKKVRGFWEFNQKANNLEVTLKKTKKVVRLKFSGPLQEYMILNEMFDNGAFTCAYRKVE